MSIPAPEAATGPPRSVVRRALLRFVLAGGVVLLVVAAATVVVARQVSREVAVNEAESRGATFARVVTAPLADGRFVAGDPARIQSFSRIMRNRLQDQSMVHVKVWDSSGRVVWSDEPGMAGQVFAFEPAVQRLLSTGGTVASMSELDKEENAGETPEAPLLEVYAAAENADGTPLIVETYWSADHIDADARTVMRRLAPLSIGALLLFALLVLPLAWSLARRVDRAQAESRTSLQHALSASDLERRRIASELHDGVMQDVSGAGYVLAAARSSLPPGGGERAGRLIDEVSSLVADVGESLRSLLADIYPANLARDGLGSAVQLLADRAGHQGVRVTVDVHGVDDLPLEVTQLCYRVVREGLRNVVRHAQATYAEVQVGSLGGEVMVRVADDGRGFDPAAVGEGHLGLRLLEDTLTDVGGSMQLRTQVGGGTVLAVTVPREVRVR